MRDAFGAKSGPALYSLVNPPQVTAHRFQDDGTIPNNDHYPLLLYRCALKLSVAKPQVLIDELFTSNKWGGNASGMFHPFEHYHSNSHKVVGVYRGSATLHLGGKSGIEEKIFPGDVLIIPAGVGQKSLHTTDDFAAVAGYPLGSRHDLCYGKPEERPQADRNIATAPYPHADPVYGDKGPLFDYWNRS